ncbi:MAG TPA: hypothetical protein VGL81_13455 [Polyangiaceae bacterium]|jgi:hypothetical protein
MGARAVDPRRLRASYPLRERLDVHKGTRVATIVARGGHFDPGGMGDERLPVAAAVRFVRSWLSAPHAAGGLADFLRRTRMTPGVDPSRLTIHELTAVATRLLEARRLAVFEHVRIAVGVPQGDQEEAQAEPALGPVVSGYYLQEDVDEPPPIVLLDDIDSQPILELVDDVEETTLHLVESVDDEEQPLDDEVAALDIEAQAQTLIAASQAGTPFCEECERLKLAAAKEAAEAAAAAEALEDEAAASEAAEDEAAATEAVEDDAAAIDAAAQAETLVAAAAEGMPFCEECEKARLAAAQGA